MGAGNAGLGILALVGDGVRLGTRAAIALVVLGVLSFALGLLVASGRRWAMVVGLLVFGGLFAIQAFGATAGAPAPAVVTLAVVLVPLALAVRATPDAGETAGSSDGA